MITLTMTIRITGITTTIITRMVTIHHITSEGDATATTGLTDVTTDAKDVMDVKNVNGTINGQCPGSSWSPQGIHEKGVENFDYLLKYVFKKGRDSYLALLLH